MDHEMDPPPGRPRGRRAAAWAVLVAGALAAGCSAGPHDVPVDKARAHEALKTALESWKKGEAIDGLKSASPPIVVQDFDWMAGQKLVDYRITGEGQDDDSNLRIPVSLTLRDAKGGEAKKDVRYIVGTSPALTVFRDVP